MENQQKLLYVKFINSGCLQRYICEDPNIKKDSYVIAESEKGKEIGKVQFVQTLKSNTEKEFDKIISIACDKDFKTDEDNKLEAKKALDFCQEEANNLDLKMNVVGAFYTLDKTKICISYLSEDRVDFRELLKVLAYNLRCRIDLRQIGGRDKAKVISGIGPCGRKLCCSSHLTSFDKITLNYAKNQMLPLNTEKLSGACGNLMCCLKYEDDTYTELKCKCPKINQEVKFEGQNYKVSGINVLNMSCKLENENAIVTAKVKDIKYKNG